MVEYLQICCPSCQRTLRVRKRYAGLEVACSHCGHGFLVEQPDEPRESATHPESPPSQAISEAERKTYDHQIAELTDELQTVRADLQKSGAELAVAAEQTQRHNLEREQLGSQVKALTEELEQLREQALVDAVQRDELADSHADLAKLRVYVQSLESRAAAAETLEQEIRTEHAQRDRLNQQIQTLSEEVITVRADLQKSGAELAVAAEQTQRHNLEREHLGSQIKELTEELERLREQAGVDAVLRDELADSRAELEQLRMHIQALETSAAAVEKLEQELKAEHAQRDLLNQQIQKLSEEVITVRAERDHLSDWATAHTAELEQLRTSLTDLEQSSHEKKAILETTSSDLRQAFEEARIGWRTEREAIERQAEQDRSNLQKVEQQLRKELEPLRQEAATLQRERDRLAQEVQQAHDRNNELTEEIRSMESKLAEATAPANITAHEPPREDLSRQVRNLQIQNEELRSLIHGLGITVS